MSTVSATPISPALTQLCAQHDAMHLAQLAAFAFTVPQLYFCREYLDLEEQAARDALLQRLQKGLTEQTFSIELLTERLVDRDYFDGQEARLRLAPEPDFEDI